jgi:hypothetical protein
MLNARWIAAGVLAAMLASVDGPRAQADPFPAEAGRLHTDGAVFRTASGGVWAWRGASGFLLFARYLRGEDVTPQLDWARREGVNVLRVFARVPPANGWPAWRDYEHPDARADFAARLDAFFSLAAGRGLRVEYTVLTYAAPLEDERRWLQQAFDAAGRHWNVFVEGANEPEVNGIDVVAAMAGVDRRGVPASYGLYERPASGVLPALDYVTVHTPRDGRWPAHALDLLTYRDLARPVVGDEPMGAAEAARAGARSTAAADFASYFGACALVAAGCTLHVQAGLEGRAPGPDEPVQRRVAAAVRAVWQAVPAAAQTGRRVEGGQPGFPLVWTRGGALAGVASILGDRAWAVLVRAAGPPAPVPPWRVTSQAAGGLVVLGRGGAR